jgi:membrane protein implicated in regulation of membrane protease activity
MDPWVIWIIVAIVLAVGEMVTLSFFLAPFSGGALLAALVSAVGGGTVLSWAVFVITSLLLLLVVRPIARSHKITPAKIRTGTAALVGAQGIVVERVANDDAVGAIRVDNGEVWTARCYEEDHVIEVGERVQIVEIRGATALVAE